MKWFIIWFMKIRLKQLKKIRDLAAHLYSLNQQIGIPSEIEKSYDEYIKCDNDVETQIKKIENQKL